MTVYKTAKCIILHTIEEKGQHLSLILSYNEVNAAPINKGILNMRQPCGKGN